MIIQARVGSTRLPGKVLQPIGGQPMLAWVVRRAGRAQSASNIIVATTTEDRDDAVVALAEDLGCKHVRGPESDVLTRYVLAADAAGDEHLVRITSDCPLIDPDLIDDVVNDLADADYASNSLPPRTFPRGLDVEAFTRTALLRAHEHDDNPASREHVTPYIYRHPDRFQLRRVASEVDASEMRWTVDTPEDLELVRRIAAGFANDRFSWREALDLVEQHPEWEQLNAGIQQKEVP